MEFIRRTLTRKALFVFTLLILVSVIAGIALNRGKVSLSANWFFLALIVLAAAVLVLFLADVIRPLNRVTREIQNLLSGKNYKRVTPSTIDEIGVVTNFFNEITQDLEKISYDIRERRRMSSELDIAAQIQKDILPKDAPALPGLDIVAKSRMASEIGGDIFDFVTSPDQRQTFIYVGDVTGHGVPAALVMMMVNTLITTIVHRNVPTGRELITDTNLLLAPRISSRLFMTAVVLRWDKEQHKIYYTGAGHEHILIYRAKDQSVQAIRSGGIALGMIEDISKIAQENEIPLEAGDVITLYTDGVTEAKNQTGEMYGLKRFQESLKKHGYRPSSESILDNLTKDFAQFVGEYVQADDITMIVIRYMGKDAPAKAKLIVNAEKKAGSKIWDWA